MKFKIPSLNLKEVNICEAVLVMYIVNIFLSAIVRWTTYGNLLVIGFMTIYCYKHRKINMNILSFCWALYIFVYPILDNAFRSEYPLYLYVMLSYITPIMFMLIFDASNIDKYSIALNGLKFLAWFQVLGVILSKVINRLYIIIAWRLLGFWSYGVAGFATDATVACYLLTIGLGILFFEYYLMKDKFSQKGILKLISLIVMFWAMIMTGKRSFLIAVVVAIFICAVILSSTDKNKLIMTIIISIFAVLIGIGVVMFFYYKFGPTNALGRIGMTIIGLKQGEDVTSMRSLWAEYMNEWRVGREWFGIGWESFKSRILQTTYTTVPNGHNVYLQVMCETGYFGLGAYLVLIISTIVSAIKNQLFYVKKLINEDNQLELVLSSIVLYVVIIFAIYCYFGNAIYDSSIFLIYFMIVAINSALTTRRKYLN